MKLRLSIITPRVSCFLVVGTAVLAFSSGLGSADDEQLIPGHTSNYSAVEAKRLKHASTADPSNFDYRARAILKADGDDFLQLKDKNRHASRAADRLAQRGSPYPFFFTHTEEPGTTLGRFDKPTVSVYPIQPLKANLP